MTINSSLQAWNISLEIIQPAEGRGIISVHSCQTGYCTFCLQRHKYKAIFFKDLFILVVVGLCCRTWAISSCWASLLVQWIRIRLPAQATLVRALVQEDPTSPSATTTEPVCLEPMLATREATARNTQKVN